MVEKYFTDQAKVTGVWHVYSREDGGVKQDMAACMSEAPARLIVEALNRAWQAKMEEED